MDKELFIKIAKLLAVEVSHWCQIHLTKEQLSKAVGFLILMVVGLSITLIASFSPKRSSPTTYQISGKNVQINNITVNQQVNGNDPQSSPSSQIKNSPLKK